MSNYQYSSDLIEDILDRAGEPTDGTSDFDASALKYLNRAYQALWNGGGEFESQINETWWWLQTEGNIILQPVISLDTVSVTNNSDSITFSSAPVPSVSGYFFRVTDHADVFKIATHTASTTNATLDSIYTGETKAAASYKLMKLDYSVTDNLGIISPMRAHQDNRFKINGIALREMEEFFPVNQIDSGVPTRFAPVNEDTIRFNRYGGSDSTDYIRIDYDYLQRPADLTNSVSEEPLVPRQYRRLLSDMALFYLYEQKDDTRATDIFALARSGIKAMAKENHTRWARMGEAGQILPRQRDLLSRKQPLRTESGLIIG